MKARLGILTLLLVAANGRDAVGQPIEIKPINDGVVVEKAAACPIELRPLPLKAYRVHPGEGGHFDVPGQPPLITIAGVSGSGAGTSSGKERDPLHFATLRQKVDGQPERETKLYVRLGSSPGFINRSSVAWSGEAIPGLQAAARMHKRKGRGRESDLITAELYIQPESDKAPTVIFVGYDADGKLIPAFSSKMFREYAAGLKPFKDGK